MLRSILTKVSIVLASLLILFVVLEVGSRWYLWQVASDEYFAFNASLRQLHDRAEPEEESVPWFFELDRYVGYRNAPNPVPNRFDQNNLGFRGDDMTIEKPDGVYRIAIVGSSLVYDPQHDVTESYPYLLEQRLRDMGYNVQVVNAGGANYTTLESMTLLGTAVLEVDPDLVIIYHGRSDAHHRLVWPPSAYRANYRGSQSVDVNIQFTPPAYEFSTMIRIVGINFGWIDSHALRYDTTIFYNPSTAFADDYRIQHLTRSFPDGIFEEVSIDEMFDANPPIYFESNLRAMVGMTLVNDVTPLLMTVSSYHDYPMDVYPRAASPAYQRAYQQHNDVTRRVASELDVPLFDFAEAMPSDAAYYSDGSHFTVAGNAIRVPIVADYLIASGLLPEI
ncbi:MAG: hypothetical protein AAF125_07775, partial [Chloroflexota bacterium]